MCVFSRNISPRDWTAWTDHFYSCGKRELQKMRSTSYYRIRQRADPVRTATSPARQAEEACTEAIKLGYTHVGLLDLYSGSVLPSSLDTNNLPSSTRQPRTEMKLAQVMRS